jgi:hypothetical protein
MQLVVMAGGKVRCLYDESIDLAALGPPEITRASHVEPAGDGSWYADLAPVNGRLLGSFERRSQALEAEQAWLEENWLAPS